jgi:hypothetical protein
MIDLKWYVIHRSAIGCSLGDCGFCCLDASLLLSIERWMDSLYNAYKTFYKDYWRFNLHSLNRQLANFVLNQDYHVITTAVCMRKRENIRQIVGWLNVQTYSNAIFSTNAYKWKLIRISIGYIAHTLFWTYAYNGKMICTHGRKMKWIFHHKGVLCTFHIQHS